MPLSFTDALKQYQETFKECYASYRNFETYLLWDAMMSSLKTKYEGSKIKH